MLWTDTQPSQPDEIITHNAAEYWDVCARARDGEFSIESWEIVSGHNGWWLFRVRHALTNKNQDK